jgi:cytochrome c oxidase subunit II
VQHSFFIPELRFKRDALPNGETVFALLFEEVGFNQQAGECAEFCGLDHSYMDFNVDVKEPEDFQNWVREEQAADAEVEATMNVAKRGMEKAPEPAFAFKVPIKVDARAAELIAALPLERRNPHYVGRSR